MKKLIIFLWILLFLSFSIGLFFKGYEFVHTRASNICLSCMGLE